MSDILAPILCLAIINIVVVVFSPPRVTPESVTISRSQAAMQQLQESFGSFLPGMGQSPGFLPHGATDMPRPPPYPLEGVQGKHLDVMFVPC